MKKVIPFLVIYVLIQQGGETIKATWSDGQPVDAMLQERMASNPAITSYLVVDQKTFDAVPDTTHTNPSPDPIKEQAILDAKNAGKTTTERLDALIKVLGL